MHNLKFQVKFYLGTLLRIVAKVAPRNCSKEVREEPGYMSFCWEKNPAVEHQRLLLITHTHTHTHTHPSWVNDFSAFLCVGRCKNLGSLKFFIRYASSSPRANIQGAEFPVSLHPEFPQGAQWVVCAAVADGLMVGTFFVQCKDRLHSLSVPGNQVHLLAASRKLPYHVSITSRSYRHCFNLQLLSPVLCSQQLQWFKNKTQVWSGHTPAWSPPNGSPLHIKPEPLTVIQARTGLCLPVCMPLGLVRRLTGRRHWAQM